MKVGAIGNGSGMGYVPMQDRIMTSISSSIARARKEGKDHVDVILRDCPATDKVLEELRESFDVQIEKSESMKVTIRFE